VHDAYSHFALTILVISCTAPAGFTFEFSSTRYGICSPPRVSARWRLQSGNGSEHDGLCDTENGFTRRARWFVERHLDEFDEFVHFMLNHSAKPKLTLAKEAAVCHCVYI
jgi:hypothetical protein